MATWNKLWSSPTSSGKLSNRDRPSMSPIANLQLECVLVRADVYDRVRTLLVDDRPLLSGRKAGRDPSGGTASPFG